MARKLRVMIPKQLYGYGKYCRVMLGFNFHPPEAGFQVTLGHSN